MSCIVKPSPPEQGTRPRLRPTRLKNRHMAVRGKILRCGSSHFQSELRFRRPPQYRQTIGQTAVNMANHQLRVFFLPLGQAFPSKRFLVRRRLQTTLIDCPVRRLGPHPATGPCSTGRMNWSVLAAVSPRLQHDGRFWICLEAEGECRPAPSVAKRKVAAPTPAPMASPPSPPESEMPTSTSVPGTEPLAF